LEVDWKVNEGKSTRKAIMDVDEMIQIIIHGRWIYTVRSAIMRNSTRQLRIYRGSSDSH